MNEQLRLRRWIVLFILLILSIASLRSIRSYDYFWHLATGRWIVEHRALPQSDPFAVASDQEEWINGEWLFEIALYPLFRAIGHSGVSMTRAVALGLLFTAAFLYAARRVHFAIALLLAAICWYGSLDRFDARPASAAVLLLVAALFILFDIRDGRKRLAAYVALTVLWINVHPSALIAPVMASTLLIDEVVARLLTRRRRNPDQPALNDEGTAPADGAVQPTESVSRSQPSPAIENTDSLLIAAITVMASAVALLINPHGFKGITAPLHLVSAIRSGRFVNAEWLPSDPKIFWLLYVVMVVGAILIATASEKLRNGWLSRTLIFVMLALLAARSVRNQGLFLAAVPFLITPFFRWKLNERLRRLLVVAAALIPVAALLRMEFGTGVDATRFPLRAVEQLVASTLTGNIYNPDQFGGLLIWTFYPERRALTDGRNELYDTFLQEHAEAREDSRKWRNLLNKYKVKLALEEYHSRGMETIDFATGARRVIPPSMAFFPPNSWALIGFDDVGMVFARRRSFPKELLSKLEYRTIRPDDPSRLAGLKEAEADHARQEIARAREKLGESEKLNQMENVLEGGGS